MEPIGLWAAVRFTAQNGDTGALLSAAAQNGLHLYQLKARPGGFCAHCAAWRYRTLASLARRAHVRLRIQKRTGLFFFLRPLLRRRGLWAGFAVFLPLLLWLQGFVWTTDYGDLSRGQQARAEAVLWAAELRPGAAITQEKLAAGEYALLQSGEFSWASLNFEKGKLVVETAAATPKPDIAAGTLHGVRAKCSGTVVRTNLISGTMLVISGQQVEAGQGLIGTARSERDGTLIFAPAAGSVQAQFEWSCTQDVPLEETISALTGRTASACRLLFGQNSWSLPAFSELAGSEVTRRWQPEILGLGLPLSVKETVHYEQEEQLLLRTEEQAQALGRLHCLQKLYAEYPDAEIVAVKQDSSVADNTLHYTASYTVIADICQPQ